MDTNSIEYFRKDLVYMEKFNSLIVGQRFKDYVSLCQYLGEPVLKANSKTSQLKRWRTFFDWVMDGRAFIIRQVFSASTGSNPEEVIINGYVYTRGHPVRGVDDE